jgi:hypothetical protein
VAEHPECVRRRLVPDQAQLQIILGSLLGGARIEGPAGQRYMRVEEEVERARYVWWKYERLACFTDSPPVGCGAVVGFRTIRHPLFDDLAPLVTHRRARLARMLSPLGIAVCMTDGGRLEIRPEVFLPAA